MLSELLSRSVTLSDTTISPAVKIHTSYPSFSGYRSWERPGSSALGFEVEKVPLFTSDGNLVDGHYATRKTGSTGTYGVVGSRYELIQPSEVQALAETCAEVAGGSVQSSYSIRDGARFGCIVALPGHLEVGTPNDKQVRMISFDSGNDGSASFSASATCLRLMCMNQWRALAIGGKSRGLSRGNLASLTIKHTRTGSHRVKQAQDIVTKMCAAFDANLDIMKTLQARKIDLKGGELREYYNRVLPEPVAPAATGNYAEDRKAADAHAEEVSEVRTIRRCWFNTFEEERNALATDPNLWLAYNSATKWMQHTMGIRGIKQDPEKRAISNLPGGTAERMGIDALNQALEMAVA